MKQPIGFLFYQYNCFSTSLQKEQLDLSNLSLLLVPKEKKFFTHNLFHVILYIKFTWWSTNFISLEKKKTTTFLSKEIFCFTVTFTVSKVHFSKVSEF